MAAQPSVIAKRCAVCSRIRAYEADDTYCLACGSQALEAECQCGRDFSYALDETGVELHCPRCGRRLRGRDDQFE